MNHGIDDYTSYIQQAETLLYANDQPITYKLLSYQLDIPFNLSKLLLYIIYNRSTNNNSNSKLVVTYCISGRHVGTDQYTICLINGSDDRLAAMQAQYNPITSIYIHSITFNKSIDNTKYTNYDILSNVYDNNIKQSIELYHAGKWLDSNAFRNNQYSNIINNTIIRKATKYTNNDAIAHNIEKTTVKPLKTEVVANASTVPPVSCDINQPATLSKSIQPSTTNNNNGVATTATNTTKPNKVSTMRSNFFGVQSSKPTSGTAPKPTTPEHKTTSLTSMFQKQIDTNKSLPAVIPVSSTNHHDVDQADNDESTLKSNRSTKSKTKSKKSTSTTTKMNNKKRKSVIDDDQQPELSDSSIGSDNNDDDIPADEPDEPVEESQVIHNWIDPDIKSTGIDIYVQPNIDMSSSNKSNYKNTKLIEHTYQNDKGYFVTEMISVCIDCIQPQCTCILTNSTNNNTVTVDDTKENDHIKSAVKIESSHKSMEPVAKKPKINEKSTSDRTKTTKNITSFFTKK